MTEDKMVGWLHQLNGYEFEAGSLWLCTVIEKSCEVVSFAKKSLDLTLSLFKQNQKHCRTIFFNFNFYFILLYNTVLVLPYIDMNPPWVYMSSQSWTHSHHSLHTISLGHPSAPAPSILYRT